MSTPVVVWVVVGTAGLLVLVALVVALARHLRGFAATIGRFQEEVASVAGEISEEAARTGRRTEDLQRKVPRRRR